MQLLRDFMDKTDSLVRTLDAHPKGGMLLVLLLLVVLAGIYVWKH